MTYDHTMSPPEYRCAYKRWLHTFKARFLRKNGHIARPRNSWIIFRKAKRREVLGTCGVVSQILGKRWRNSPDDRKTYGAIAAVEKALHRLVFTEYKYSPAKKGEGKKRRRAAKDTHPTASASVESARPSRACPPQAPLQATYHPTADQYLDITVPTTLQTYVAGSLPFPDHPQIAGTASYGAPLPFGAENQCGELDVQFGLLPHTIGPSTTINTMYTAPFNGLFHARPPRSHHYFPYSLPPYEHPQHPTISSISSRVSEVRTFSPPLPDSFPVADYWCSVPSNGSVHFRENPRLSTGPPPFMDVKFGGGFSTQGFDPLSLRGSRSKRAVEPHTTMTSWPTNSFAIENSGGPCLDFGFDGFF